MRWRLLRRRLSISAPHMAVRSHLPWPLRWAVAALMLGFSAALALWAFEFGRSLASWRPNGGASTEQVAQLQRDLAELRLDRDQAQALAHSADSLLKAERVTQQRLAEQVRTLEAENQSLKDDLGFFERLLPATGERLAIRGLQLERPAPGQLRYQLLIMQQAGRTPPELKGRVEVQAMGTLEGRAWSSSQPLVRQALQLRQSRRLDGVARYPEGVVLKQVQVRVLDEAGAVRATQLQRL